MTGSSGFAPERDSTLRSMGEAALVIGATVALYWGALSAGFVGDDFMILHRLRATHGAEVFRFFRTEFFEFYRPLGFLSQALDWSIAGSNPSQFHLTNLVLHALNAVLVLLIGRRLSPGTPTGLIAALLFAFHASNNEAVFWISARFDLLATCFALGAVYCLVLDGRAEWLGPVLFVGAVLSKESAVALPIAVAAWWAVRRSAPTITTVVRVAPWLGGLVLYGVLRNLGGGVSAIGGVSRIPKLAILALALLAVVLLANGRSVRVRDWVRDRRGVLAWAGLAFLVILAAAAWSHASAGALAREKLSVAAFAIFCLVSPVLDIGEAGFSDPGSATTWMIGLGALLFAGLVVLFLWRRLVDDERMWFLAAWLFSTLLPISALTDGKRYLYLPSAVLSLSAAMLIAERRGRSGRAGFALVGVVLVISTIQIELKARDWIWAGRMTAQGSRLVDAALAPGCGTGDVVFLTSPVGIRGVYTHFYYETFELARGCQPAQFQVVARVTRLDSPIDVRWVDRRTIEITARQYRGNFLLSHDLRSFDVPLKRAQSASVSTPLGEVTAEPRGPDVVLRLTLSSTLNPDSILFFYYADGAIHPLRSPSARQSIQPAHWRTPPAMASSRSTAAATRVAVLARQAQAAPNAARTAAAG